MSRRLLHEERTPNDLKGRFNRSNIYTRTACRCPGPVYSEHNGKGTIGAGLQPSLRASDHVCSTERRLGALYRIMQDCVDSIASIRGAISSVRKQDIHTRSSNECANLCCKPLCFGLAKTRDSIRRMLIAT